MPKFYTIAWVLLLLQTRVLSFGHPHQHRSTILAVFDRAQCELIPHITKDLEIALLVRTGYDRGAQVVVVKNDRVSVLQ